MISDEEFEQFRDELEKDLVTTYGHLIGNQDLSRLLGFEKIDSFKQALKRKQIGVPVFSLEKKRGKYALAKDVALYLAKLRFAALTNDE